MPTMHRKFWLVSVDTTTVHRVYAKDEGEALSLVDTDDGSLTAVESITTHQHADIDEDQTLHNRRVWTLEAK